jgi:hypothetical protein
MPSDIKSSIGLWHGELKVKIKFNLNKLNKQNITTATDIINYVQAMNIQ